MRLEPGVNQTRYSKSIFNSPCRLAVSAHHDHAVRGWCVTLGTDPLLNVIRTCFRDQTLNASEKEASLCLNPALLPSPKLFSLAMPPTMVCLNSLRNLRI